MSINNFGPFNADVWGSVSDWMMIFVTALTAYFLYKTLKLQAKNSSEQSELFLIEQKRFIKQILPRLSFYNRGTSLSPFVIETTVTTENAPIFNLTLSFEMTDNITLKHVPKGSKLEIEKLDVGVSVVYVFEWSDSFPENTPVEVMAATGRIKVLYTFENEIGVKYKQESVLAGTTFFSQPPIRLSN